MVIHRIGIKEHRLCGFGINTEAPRRSTVEAAPKRATNTIRGLTQTDRLSRSEGSMQPTQITPQYAICGVR